MIHCTALTTRLPLFNNGHSLDSAPDDMLLSIDVLSWDVVAAHEYNVDRMMEHSAAIMSLVPAPEPQESTNDQ